VIEHGRSASQLHYAGILGLGLLAITMALNRHAAGAETPGGLIWKREQVEAGAGSTRQKVAAEEYRALFNLERLVPTSGTGAGRS
jgi:hypothetical protein